MGGKKNASDLMKVVFVFLGVTGLVTNRSQQRQGYRHQRVGNDQPGDRRIWGEIIVLN